MSKGWIRVKDKSENPKMKNMYDEVNLGNIIISEYGKEALLELEYLGNGRNESMLILETNLIHLTALEYKLNVLEAVALIKLER